MARTFDGANDSLHTSSGALSALTFGTFAAIIKRNGTTFHNIMTLHNSGGTSRSGIELEDNAFGNSLQIQFDGTNVTSSFTVLNADNWVLVAAGKATGTATPRMHKYVYDTNTWTHEDAGGTAANATAPGASSTMRFGEWEGTDDFAGDIAVAGCWMRNLSDAEVEQLAASLIGWISTAPDGLWVFDQQATTSKLLDFTGGGANESALTGTTVSTSSVPVFGYGHDVLALSASASAAALATVPFNPQRAVQLRDPGEVPWLQRDRRDASLVATTANDLAAPLLVAEHQRQAYALSALISRSMVVPQQPDRHLRALDAAVANDLAAPLFQPAGSGYWHLYNDTATRDRRAYFPARLYYDPSLLTPAEAMPAPPPQRIVPPWDYGESQWTQGPRRDPSLLTTALLENELLGGADTSKRYLTASTHRPRWWMAQQQQSRQGFSPGLLDSALLETPLLGAADDLTRHRMWFTDRREMPQQRTYFDLSLLLAALLESPLLWVRPPGPVTDRRTVVPPPRQFDPSLLAVTATDPLSLGNGDQLRRYLTPATNAGRRMVPQQPPRRTLYFDAGPDVPPLTLAWGVGGNLWHLYNPRRPARSWWPAQFVYSVLAACSVTRPSSGITVRPTGTTTRPGGMTLQPGTGITTRPATGDTTEPC